MMRTGRAGGDRFHAEALLRRLRRRTAPRLGIGDADGHVLGVGADPYVTGLGAVRRYPEFSATEYAELEDVPIPLIAR